MSLTELLPAVQGLSRLEKIRLIEVVAGQLQTEEDPIHLIKPGESYHVFSPDKAYEAAATMMRVLEDEKKAQR